MTAPSSRPDTAAQKHADISRFWSNYWRAGVYGRECRICRLNNNARRRARRRAERATA